MTLTTAQRKWLIRLVHDGRQTGPYRDNFHVFDRVMAGLVKLGYAAEYVHGGHEVTPAGREALRLLGAEHETKASRALANSNEEREAGNLLAAERWDVRAQNHLDVANEIQGRGSV